MLSPLLLIPNSATANTVVDAPITTDTTWNLAGSPYLVTAAIVPVEENATLTIEPGVEVRFDVGRILEVRGALIAIGTPSQRVLFTANSSTPSPGYWWGVETRFDGSVEMAWVNMTYATNAVTMYSSNNTLRDCEVSLSYRSVLIVSGSNVTTSGSVTNNTVERCYMHDNPSPPGMDNMLLSEGLFYPCFGHIIRDNVFANNEGNDIRAFGCGRNRIENNAFSGGPTNGPARAIWLDFSGWNYVANNTMVGPLHGMLLRGERNNTIRGNSVFNATFFGFDFLGWATVSNNTLEGNLVSGTPRGIWIHGAGARNNTIRNNTVQNNAIGIEVNRTYFLDNIDYGPPLDNRIYHNRIINNTVQAKDNSTPDGNAWDIGCPGGGNYWSDYAGVDTIDCGTGLPGSDGLGDAPYVIDADSRDSFPLMSPTPPDLLPPETYNATIAGESVHTRPLSQLAPLPFQVVADDVRTGGSNISAGNVTLGPANWTSAAPLAAEDGAFDEVNETLVATLVPPADVGDHVYCAYASDVAGNANLTGACATLTVVDDLPPQVYDAFLDGSPALTVPVGTASVTLTATVDDSGTGASLIGGANVTSPPGAWGNATPLLPVDALDSPVEAFTLTVDTSALPAGSYALCVYGWDAVPNHNATGDCATLTVSPPSLPDLVVTPANLFTQPPSPILVGTPTTLNATTQNLGTATAQNFTLTLFVDADGDRLPGPGETIAALHVDALSPSDGVSSDAPWIPPFPGTYDLCALADSEGNVTEADEGDNAACVPVDVFGFPDYVPWNPSPAPNVQVGLGQNLTLSVQAMNVGDDNATAPSNLAFFNATTPAQPFAGVMVPPLPAGGVTGMFAATWTAPSVPGTYSVTVSVDHLDELKEWDETNNAFSWTVTVPDVPVTTLVVGEPNHTATRRYVTSATPLSFRVEDRSGTGINLTEYRVDGGAWTVLAGPSFTLTGDGAHAVEYRSVDNLGSREDARTEALIVDDAPPMTVGAAQLLPNGSHEVRVSASDALSGVSLTYYRTDGGAWATAPTPEILLLFDAPGTHRVEYYSVDNLGNQEPVRSTEVVVAAPPGPGNLKPLVAIAFAAILLVSGLVRAVRRPRPFDNPRLSPLRTSLLLSLPFVLAEIATGIVSHLYGILTVPPMLGLGTVVDLGILLGGILVLLARPRGQDTSPEEE